jgi:pyruvate dehydrogenase E1 component alpha subunit
MDLPALYRHMLRSRLFELAVADLWNKGLVSGEMHLGTGEEAVAAGVVSHVREGDGLALAHRCTPPLVVRGVPLVPMLREMLGRPDGLCGGRGGHMHLASRAHLAAASGIVGASLPAAAGFALAARRLRPGAIGAAFTGEGAMNQGQALETLNLASAWSLPMVVICVDNGWAITTRSESVTGGDLVERASAFGWHTARVDGTDASAVHEVAGELVAHAREGHGPSFLLADCPRLDGHFLGDPLLRQARDPLGPETRGTLSGVVSGVRSGGASGLLGRARSLIEMGVVMARASLSAGRGSGTDPIVVARASLRASERQPIDDSVEKEIREVVERALADEPSEAASDA